MIIISLSIIFLVVGVVLFRPYLNPVSVMAGQWLVVGVLQSIFVDRYFYISLSTYVALFIFLLMCTIGIMLGYFSNRSRFTDIALKYEISYLLKIGACITYISTPLILFRIYQIGLSGPTDNIFVNIRYLTSTGLETLGFLEYIMLFSLVLMASLGCVYYSGNKKAKLLFYSVLLCVFICNAATLARGSMVSVIVIYFVMTYTYGRLTVRKVLPAVILPLIGFIFITTVLNKTSGSPLQTLADYLVPPLIAFDITKGVEFSTFENYGSVVSGFSRLLNSFGFDIPIVNYVLPFVYTPTPTNLYTVMKAYYSFGGMFGVAMGGFVIGLIHGNVWRASFYKLGHWKILYAFSFIPLVSHFGSESYLTLFSYWTQVIFWSFILSPKRLVTNSENNVSTTLYKANHL